MPTAIGLELTASAIRTAVVSCRGSDGAAGLTLDAAQDIPCDTANPDALTHALARLRLSLPIRQGVVLGLPSASAIITHVEPLVPYPRRAMLGVQFELQQQLPFELQDAAWHHHWLSSPRAADKHHAAQVGDAAAARPAAVAAAMRRSVLEQRLACCARAGVPVQAVVINAIAILNASRLVSSDRMPEPAEGSATPAALGSEAAASSARHVLFHVLDELAGEWIVWTPASVRVIPVRGASPDAFQDEVVASFRLLQEPPQQPVTAVHVVGSSAAWPRIQLALASQAHVDVKALVLPLAHSDGASGADPQPSGGAAAIGLALQGLRRAAVPLNLLAGTQQERRVSTLRSGALIASGVCLVLSLAIGLQGMRELRHRRLQLRDQVERQERLYRSLRPQVRAMLQRQEHAQERLQRLRQLAEGAGRLPQLVAQVAQGLPDDVWLTALACAKVQPVGAASSQERLEVSLEGRATSFQALTQLMDRLKTVADMTTVKPLSTSVTTDPLNGKEVVLFSIQAQKAPRELPRAASAETDASTPALSRKTRSRRR